MNSGMVHFIGAGCGAADLITVRGARLLSRADVIVYAGSLINPELLDYAAKECRLYDSSTLDLEEILSVMISAAKNGQSVVRLHSGDPSLYGAIREQMDGLAEKKIACDITPGVSACFGAAASLGLEYTLPGISQSLIITRMEGRTRSVDNETIEAFAALDSTMAIYLSTSMIANLSKKLILGGYAPDTPAAIVYKATWPDEQIFLCSVDTLEQTASENNITKTAVILVGKVLDQKGYDKSRLYDKAFETEYRHAR